MEKTPKKIVWDDISERQDLYLRLLWEDHFSEKAIADFFHTTKGTIVRRRHKLGLKRTSLRPPPQKVTRNIDPDRFRDLLDIYALEEQDRIAAAITPEEDQE